MPDFAAIRESLLSHADPDKAPGMRRYMKDQFEFFGVQSPLRRQVIREHFQGLGNRQLSQALKNNDFSVDWEFIDHCWADEHRELQYVAIDYFAKVKSALTPQDIPRLKRLVQIKSWWDTVDGIDTVVGDIALRYPEVNATLVQWSVDSDMWLRRVAINHQRGRKDQTDEELLEEILVNNLGQREFFINKAIGWALRDYSKSRPEWVRAFIAKYRDRMAPLSMREGSKYI